MKPKFWITAVFIWALFGCGNNDEPEYPIIPEITFKEYQFNRDNNNGLIEDSYTVVFEYLDGDGDIGIADNEPGLPGDTSIKHVLFVDYFEESKTGTFKRVACALGSDTTSKKYRLPIITPPGNNKAIKGEISVKLLPCPVPFDTTKVIKYSMYLYDRQAHKSNVIETPSIFYETQKQ